MAKYEVGEIIHHKRYDYRGVVIAVDPICTTPEMWHTPTTPPGNCFQNWYHVLVHGGFETYVAEENLEPDPLGREIRHPFVHHIFPMYLHGRYYRYSPN